jgi:signal transduction histidine kinase
VLTASIMGYLDTMGTFARLAEPHAKRRAEPGRPAEQQAALRRVATLVAAGAPSSEVFDAVAREVAQVLHLRNAAVGRYDEDGAVMTVLASAGFHPDAFYPGSRWPLDGPSMARQVLRTGRPVRMEHYDDLPGRLAAAARDHGLNRVAGAPVIVDGRVWGLVATSSPDEPLPDDLEERLAEFTELVATAIANSEAHRELARLAEEQAALRRVATLVAAGARPPEVFEAVSAEVAALIPADGSALTRFEADGSVTALSGWTTEGGYTYVGKRYELEGTVSGVVFESGRPGRVESYADAPGEAPDAAREMGWRSSVGAPITVEGRLWGVLAVISKSEEPLPPDTEERLAEFTDLVATAIANSEAHEEVARLAEEQAALRRVATLAAQGAPPGEVIEAVSTEVARLVRSDGAGVTRYEDDGTFTALGGWSSSGVYSFTGKRFALEGSVSELVFETYRPSRIESFENRPGEAAAAMREMGWQSAAGAPISVEGRLWGVLVVYSHSEPLPPGTEGRLGDFAELVATAIANAESRAELDASRARIVATADATRRRIERDLHDGAQQRLVSLALEVRAAQASAPKELSKHRDDLSHIAEGLTTVLDGLREIALGIHPAILAEGGLGPALKTLAHRSPIPVELDVRRDGRLAESVEVAAYYVVSEALTNAAKHSCATKVEVEVGVDDRTLRVTIRDDGEGGADPARGSGLLGLKDRAEAIGGTIALESRQGTGTTLIAELPLDITPPAAR